MSRPSTRRPRRSEPDAPLQLPIHLGPQTPRSRRIRAEILARAETISRRQGLDRREFLAGACGMALSLQVLNLLGGCSDSRSRPLTRDATVPSPVGGDSGSTTATDAATGFDAATAATDAARPRPDAAEPPLDAGGDGGFALPEDAARDAELASCLLGVDLAEAIIDMQLHFQSPLASAIGNVPMPQPTTLGRMPWILRTRGCGGPGCYDRGELLHQVFMRSDTTVGLVSGLPYALRESGGGEGIVWLSNEDLIGGVDVLNQKLDEHVESQPPLVTVPRKRVLSQAAVMPDDRLELQLAAMTRLAPRIAAWTLNPGWSPDWSVSNGYWLDEEPAAEVIAHGLDLGRPIFCVRKGVPHPNYNPAYGNPRDIGPAALQFPQAHFVVYHSAFEYGLQPDETSLPPDDTGADLGWGPGVGMWPEGPYVEDDPDVQALYPLDRGVNSLISSLRASGIGPNGQPLDGSSGPTTHVYAECGHAWANLMLRPQEAMHFFGKLLLHVGEDRVLWGTDCIWYGNPTPLIQAFRSFEISTELQERYGYPALTPRIKRKILADNAARLLSRMPDFAVTDCTDQATQEV